MFWGSSSCTEPPAWGPQYWAQTPHFLGRTSTIVIILLFWHFLSREGGLDHTRSLPLLPVLWVFLYIFGSGGLVAKLCPTLATPWTVACQAPLSMGFSRQEYWSGLSFPSPGLISLVVEKSFLLVFKLSS